MFNIINYDLQSYHIYRHWLHITKRLKQHETPSGPPAAESTGRQLGAHNGEGQLRHRHLREHQPVLIKWWFLISKKIMKKWWLNYLLTSQKWLKMMHMIHFIVLSHEDWWYVFWSRIIFQISNGQKTHRLCILSKPRICHGYARVPRLGAILLSRPSGTPHTATATTDGEEIEVIPSKVIKQSEKRL